MSQLMLTGAGPTNPYWPASIPALAAWYDTTRGVYSDGGAHFTAASSQYLSIASNSTAQMGDGVQFTIFGWVKFDAVGSRGILTKWASSGSDLEYALTLESNVLKMYGRNTAGTTTSAVHGSTLTTATWYFVAGGWDGTNLWCSVNGGARVTTALSGGVRSSANTFRVGTLDGTQYFMDGSVDSLGFAKRSYSDAELIVLYTAGVGRVYADLATIGFDTTLLVSYWDLNEEIGTRYDAHGTNHLTASNTVLISPSVLNGGFETAGTGGADVFGSWTESVAGSSTINDETTVINGGAHACRYDIDGSNSTASIYQTVLVVGNRYSYSLWAKASSGTPTIRVHTYSQNKNTHTLSTTYAQYSGSFVADSGATAGFYISNSTATSLSVYIDDITLTDLGPVGVAGIAAGLATDGNFCGQFNGTSQYLRCASNATVQTGDVDFFLSAWVMFDQPPSTYNFIAGKCAAGSITGAAQEYWLGCDSTQFYLGMGDNNTHALNLAFPTTVSTGKWYHVIAWHDATNNTATLAVNGVTGTPSAWTYGSWAGTANFSIGGASAGGYYTSGRIDSVVLGKPPTSIAPLASTIVSTLFNGGEGTKPSALTTAQKTAWGVVAGWDLDKKAGITVDSIGTNTLTNTGAVTYGQGVNYLEAAVSKWLDQSASARNATQATNSKRPAYVTSYQNGKAMFLFDGIDDILSFTSLALSTAHTAFIVINPVALTGVLIGGTSTNSLFTLGATNVTYNAQGTSVAVAHGMSVNTAYVLSVIRNGTTVQFFKNGVQIGTDQTLGANSTLTVTTLGAYSDSTSPCSTYIADPVVYATALTSAQHTQVVNFLRTKYAI